ncbi:uncharacterized protein LOC114252602 [Bombyx mandarina]|uniref:Uncharacterized protein LOC114252602 n=1 Tax=Bombyx mandarina TaxID=7092 RepID=A0A6J2KPR1_BOMMA|nr:uncharacterized protein LOC114252602 [Bombyx mandarina]
MMRIRILLLAFGVVTEGWCLAPPSPPPDDRPMEIPENLRGRQLDTPAVVLQLKYDDGELDRIYLAQFRRGNAPVEPPVPARTELCADLCHSGLGGAVCGGTCTQMIPVGLQSALEETNSTDAIYGEPRFSVCPALCGNSLGYPLCNCVHPEEDHAVDWSAVCTAFCTDGYTLGGCPACASQRSSLVAVAGRILNTSEGWQAWCNVQCRQGHGGAACNCDRTPFQ